MEYTLNELSERVGGKIIGDGQCYIRSVATLKNGGSGDISFLSNSIYQKQLKATRVSAVILTEKNAADCPTNAMIVTDPHVSYAKVATLLHPQKMQNSGIHPSACIHDSADLGDSVSIAANCYIGERVKLGRNVQVGPGCVIEDGVVIGDNSIILANVTLCHGSELGGNVLLHPGVVIGSDGFGQANDKGNWLKIPQIGRVIIGDDVEIGANTTIDRGAIEDTLIGDNVKLDNQIQIAHNVHIGAHTVIAAATGIAGSTRIGKHCAIGGAVGIVGHIEIADNVMITGKSFVTNSVKLPGSYSSGTTLDETRAWHKSAIRFKQLDTMARRIKALEKKLEQSKK